MKLFRRKDRKGELLEYLDKLSGGLFRPSKPDELKYSKEEGTEEIKGDDFRFSYYNIKSGCILPCPDECAFRVVAKYDSPVGVVNFRVVGWPGEKDKLEKRFPKKREIDDFLEKINEKNDGILKEMIKDNDVDSSTDNFREDSPAEFKIEIFDTSVSYSLEVKSRKGRFWHIGQDPSVSGRFSGFSEHFDVDGTNIEVKGLTAVKYAYGKIDEESAKKEVKQKLEEEVEKTPLTHLKDFKIKKAIIDDGIEEIVADDSIGYLRFSREVSGFSETGPEYREFYSYEIQAEGIKDKDEKIETIKAYDCYVREKEDKIELNGNPLLIVKLGRELTGKANYGLLD
jgi:hypothetical protein